MIHSFSCKNFYSFGDSATVNFVVNEKAPNNNGYFTTPSDIRLSKVETVLGPNASGKTSLMKALPFLKWLIADSFSIKPTAPMPVKPFAFGDKKEKPIELAVEFEMEGSIYTYSFVIDEKKILEEELKIKNKSISKITSKKIFSRKWNKKDKKYKLDDKNFDLPKEFEEALRTNASIVSLAVQFRHKESQKISDYWQKVQTNVMENGWVHDAEEQLLEALDFYSEEENKRFKDESEKILSRFDLGLESFDIEKKKSEKKDDEFMIKVKVAHHFGNETAYLPIYYESSGTQQLFVLLRLILPVLKEGSIAVLDEFDVNLHPDIIVALFELFVNPETNPNNAQLLFSTHNHLVLTRLDKYQITLTEKNEKGESEAWRLDEMSGVRSDDNYYNKYIAGAYGAVPKI